MTEAKHTPGPWLVGEDQCIDECWSIVTTSGGAIIANVNDQAARQANVRLIAASPCLLAALEQLLPQNLGPLPDGQPDSLTVPVDMTFGEIRRARAAIAKARGQS